jgi:Family of unknown function (DUF5677)
MDIIKIGESEFPPLLDRGKALADVKRAFSGQLEMLRDVTNYGTNLIPRCFGSSDKGLKDVVVLTILLRQVVAMLDGFELLVSNGSVHTAALQARALFEASAYIDWILSADSEKKATYYYVHNLRRQRRWAQRFQQGSPEATAFAALGGDLPSLRDQNAIDQAAKTLKDIDRVLSQTAFAVVSQAFDKYAPKGRKGDQAWYVPLGMRSLSGIASAIGRSAEYAVFYSTWSETMHSSNYAQHVRVGQGTITFEPIRKLSGFRSLFTTTAATVLNTYRKILEHYRPGELQAHFRKYRENWQKALMEVPTIKYEVTTRIPTL